MTRDASSPVAAWRPVAVASAALGLYAIVAAAVIYAFGVKQVGYYLFDASDIGVYFEFAASAARGGRPYVDFPVEYPPLALWVFDLGGPPRRLDDFAVRFALAMLAVGAVTAVVTALAAARLWPAGRTPYVAAGGFAAAVAATGGLVVNRYDVAVALVVAAFLLLVAHRRPVAAAAALGVGFALKLVPAILLPLALLLATTRAVALRAAAAFAVAALLPFVPHLPQGLEGLAGTFSYHGQRPLQVESVLATPYWIAQLLGLVRLRIVSGFGAQNVVAPGADALARASSAIGLAALGLAYAAVWRRRDALRAAPALAALAAAAVLLAFVACGKVLSPQYLIWFLPVVALLLPQAPGLAALLLGVMVLTQIEFPAHYDAFIALHPAAVLLVVARNLALAGAFAWSVVRLWRPAHAVRPQG